MKRNSSIQFTRKGVLGGDARQAAPGCFNSVLAASAIGIAFRWSLYSDSTELIT